MASFPYCSLSVIRPPSFLKVLREKSIFEYIVVPAFPSETA